MSSAVNDYYEYMNETLEKKLTQVPHAPGVYIYKDEKGIILYIGKARDLKNRVSQYFHNDGDGRIQIPFLIKDVADVEYIITDTEIESLLLENNLIKKFRPKFNIKLRDDKNYVFIKIDYSTQIPQLCTVRNPDSDNARYFGPYSSAFKVRETLNIIRKVFPYCANAEVGTRPCFYYYLHRCPGVCIGTISVEEYKNQTIKKIALFLAGNISEIRKEITTSMKEVSRKKMYERAANFRDQLRSLSVIEERQKAMFAKKVDWDFVSYFVSAASTTANVLLIRNGKLIDSKNFILDDALGKPLSEIAGVFMQNYYSQTTDKPKDIYVQELPDILETLQSVLLKDVKILKPKQGKKAELIELGKKNAKEFFETWSMNQATELSRTTLALDELGKILGLPEAPNRIECFDISNTQGTNAVASMVVFENARPKKSEYRKFKIKQDGTPNDFAMMRETLLRRFNPEHRTEGSTAKKWPLPDLLVIDGGKGQLGIAVQVLAEYKLQIPVIGLAKREEEIFKPGISEPILLSKSDYALQLLQRLRDEAHRFGITFHKKLRSKEAYTSALDSVPGIGPIKKKALLKKFGSVAQMKLATSEEVAEVIGSALAKELFKWI